MPTSPEPPDSDLELRWTALRAALLARSAYATLSDMQPGLAPAEVEAAFHRMGIKHAGQVGALFAQVNGPSPEAHGPIEVFPGMDLLSMQSSVRLRETMLRSARMPAGYGYPKLAGWPAFQFIPEFVPIAEGERDLLVADARGGNDHGRVFRYDKVLADDVSVAWPDLASFLNEVAAAISSGSALQDWTPVIRDSRLYWIRPS